MHEESPRKHEKFEGSDRYNIWRHTYEASVGVCALVTLDEIDGVRWCFLHMILNMVNKVLSSTFLSYATALEADGKPGVYRFAAAYKAIGMPTRANTMVRKYDSVMEQVTLISSLNTVPGKIMGISTMRYKRVGAHIIFVKL